MQLPFSKSFFFNSLALAAVLFGFAHWLRQLPDEIAPEERTIALRFEALEMAPLQGGQLVGAWQLSADDPRFGGISGAATDHGRLIGISDSGSVLWLDLPGTHNPRVTIKGLPAVPGPANRKVGRDSEAIAPDPSGRGWWVAFEQRHSLLLYDEGFHRLLARKPLHSSSFRPNHGVEALYADGRRLVALPESTGASDSVRLADGRVALLKRGFGLTGLRSSIAVGEVKIALPLGPLDNPEAIAAAPLAGGGTRLWVLTDNDFRAAVATKLVAIDVPPAKAGGSAP